MRRPYTPRGASGPSGEQLLEPALALRRGDVDGVLQPRRGLRVGLDLVGHPEDAVLHERLESRQLDRGLRLGQPVVEARLHRGPELEALLLQLLAPCVDLARP